MHKFYTYMLTLFVFVLSQAIIGHCIECYTCRSETDPDCGSGTPDAKYLKNCSTIRQGPKYRACRKIENYVDFEVLNQKPTKRIIRQCAVDVDVDRPCYYRAGFGGRANVCDCFEDKCNHASTVVNSLLISAVCIISVLVFL
ncbi:uncharacterized protein LOC129216029 [Uloborus diversus]|uniref:uncharacterized protein LOC129216029 n=1 Tax=Uloborus diversus TaxID=327109 RepID=UPI002409C15F|nr:uncharacterized protein LOC129216029 [Uloborus diversus]